VPIFHSINYPEVTRLLTSPGGGVSRDIHRRGRNVERMAQRVVRKDTGTLAASIHTERMIPVGVKVGTNLRYARYVHYGTGIYGPYHRPITSKRGKYLVFWSKKYNRIIYTKKVRGQTPNPFLQRALVAAYR